ncbi:FecR family protein [Mucilaginibacter sp. AW1-7]|uniref:FecR family protein n=1 Tax=Mucilaginibacter sp. AW1-7 TaxID=3349874 RepID=UPI003F741C93
MDQDTIWTLVGKKLNNEATPEELRQLHHLLMQPWADVYSIQILEAMWRQNPNKPPRFIPHKLQQKWDKLESRLETGNTDSDTFQSPANEAVPRIKNTKRRVIQALVAAACLVFALLSFFYWKNYSGNYNVKTYQVVAAGRNISKIVLPDGTKVWLNAGSEIFYKTNYGNGNREIRLTGEAFFDVVKDAEHPFIVNTASMRIKVLGTAFNVRSYANDNVSETSLIRGRIELITTTGPKQRIILKPAEKLTILNPKHNHNNKDEALITLSTLRTAKTDSLPSEAQWLENKLVFDNEYFDEVAKKMERWYGVSISFKNDGLKEKKFSGKFTTESLSTALEALRATSNFNFLIEYKKVIIY